jgi:hypothetical protein
MASVWTLESVANRHRPANQLARERVRYGVGLAASVIALLTSFGLFGSLSFVPVFLENLALLGGIGLCLAGGAGCILMAVVLAEIRREAAKGDGGREARERAALLAGRFKRVSMVQHDTVKAPRLVLGVTVDEGGQLIRRSYTLEVIGADGTQIQLREPDYDTLVGLRDFLSTHVVPRPR